MSFHRLWIVLLVAACAAPPSTAPSPGGLLDDDGVRLLRAAERDERELDAKGLVLVDDDLLRYLQGVASRLLLRELPGGVRPRFAVLRDPVINAFGMPNGVVYLHAGLLARLENEAQLAHVMAHESAHLVMQHALHRLRGLRSRRVAAKIAHTILTPTAVAAAGGAAGSLVSMAIDLSGAAAANGFERAQEEAADLWALRRVARAGYPVGEVPRLFALLAETEQPGPIEAFLYSSHPSNAARAAHTRALVATGDIRSSPGARARAQEYRRATEKVALESIELRLRARHYAFALAEVDRALQRYGASARLLLYTGEVHRRMGEDPEGRAREEAWRSRKELDERRVRQLAAWAPQELAAAADAYREALDLDPEMSEARRGLGIVAHRLGDRETARIELEAYLERTPYAPDRRYVEWLLEQASE